MTSSDPQPVELAIDGGAHEWAAMNAALAAGEIDEDGWYRWYMSVLVPIYLAADNPRAQSGHSGDEAGGRPPAGRCCRRWTPPVTFSTSAAPTAT